jgi:N-acetylated-alpha-linked acidic dipeptidase
MPRPFCRRSKGPVCRKAGKARCPFRYHLGPGGVKVHLVSQQDYQRRIIWDVIGKIEGSQDPGAWVIVGNHRDAWVYGAVDPSTAAPPPCLNPFAWHRRSASPGLAARRTIVFCSWDAEEEGLIGSTEWVEQQGRALDHAVAYFNVDVGVSGPDFSASAVPSLKEFVRDIRALRSQPAGGTVYRQWHSNLSVGNEHRGSNAPPIEGEEVHLGDLGSGSDFTPFLQHAGVPSTDIESNGPYGVYHSAFDDFAWFTQNADPHFLYLQQMARVFGLEAMRMADADVLPLRLRLPTRAKSPPTLKPQSTKRPTGLGSLDFAPAGKQPRAFPPPPSASMPSVRPIRRSGRLNLALRQTERRCSPIPAFPAAPGTGTPSLLPASSLATPPSSSPASTRPSMPAITISPRSN